MNQSEKLKKIADFAQLASILEVSSFKPGNVDPLYDFGDTGYEDFLRGAVALRSAIEDSASLGFRAGKCGITQDRVRIGKNIKKAVYDVKRSHKGGNTHLGTAMLFVPISAGAGFCIAENSDFQKSLRNNTKEIIINSTVEDSINFYDAVKIANAGGLNGRLIEKKIPFYKLMKISAKKDRIAEELSSGMKIVFGIGHPLLNKFYNKTDGIRKATTATYLSILSEFPDTLISKKAGLEKADGISVSARLVLNGEKSIEAFDRELRSRKNELNPGTTADIVAASIFVWLLMREF